MHTRNKPNTQQRGRINRRRMLGNLLVGDATGIADASFSSSKDLTAKVFEHLTNLAIDHGEVTGVPTGYRRLDQLTAGLQPSDLIIVAARPTMGKTAFALSIAMNAAVNNHIPVCVFSLDMSKEHLMTRMLGIRARVDASRLRRPAILSDEAWNHLGCAAKELSAAPLFIDDTPALSTLELRSRTLRIKTEHNIGLVVVDYLQLMRTNRYTSCGLEISDIPRSLNALAKEIKTPIVALSQLDRKVEHRRNNRPILTDLPDSGLIERFADVLLFIYREDLYKYKNPSERPLVGNAEIIIGKQRNGPLGSVALAYFAEYTTFADKAFGTSPFLHGT